MSILSFIKLHFDFVDSMRKDDWDATYIEAMRLGDTGIVLFYQDYDLNIEDPTKRPLVLVLHDILCVKMQFVSPLESLRPLIQLSKQLNMICLCMLVLYPTNAVETCMFFICCAVKTFVADKNELKLCLEVVFEAIGNVRPTCIVIDKHKTSPLAIQKVVDEDKYCWRDELEGTEEIAEKLLLCGFHIMKAWSEYLLTRGPFTSKKMWQSLYILMDCSSKITFDYELKRFYNEFKDI